MILTNGTKLNQQQTIENFIQGNFNVLVTTCIGEEGLDIGYVDLIVFMMLTRLRFVWCKDPGKDWTTTMEKVIILVNEKKENRYWSTPKHHQE